MQLLLQAELVLFLTLLLALLLAHMAIVAHKLLDMDQLLKFHILQLMQLDMLLELVNILLKFPLQIIHGVQLVVVLLTPLLVIIHMDYLLQQTLELVQFHLQPRYSTIISHCLLTSQKRQETQKQWLNVKKPRRKNTLR